MTIRRIFSRVRIIVTVLVILIAVLGFAVPAYAVMPLPDAPSQVLTAYVFPGCAEPGDIGIFVVYSIPYAVVPATIVSDAYAITFIDTDGVTQLASASPYVYVNSGYSGTTGEPAGIAWMYLTAAEVTAYGISSALIASYDIQIVGNPTLVWAGAIPLTIGSLTSWGTEATTRTQLGLKVLQTADTLGIYWSLALSQESPMGTVLTTTGEQYFVTSIPNLRSMCPQIFAAGAVTPTKPYLDYESGFGAIITNLAGTVAGSPITLVAGVNNVNLTAPGTLTVSLAKGTGGTATSDVAVVTGSPTDLVAGDNVITVGGAGNFKITLAVSNTQSRLWSPIAGTVFDLTPLANKFGISVMLASGLAWLLVTIIICASVYSSVKNPDNPYDNSSGKVVMLVFDICFIGGAVLGMLSLLVAILMFIGFGLLTGYVIFFRSAGM